MSLLTSQLGPQQRSIQMPKTYTSYVSQRTSCIESIEPLVLMSASGHDLPDMGSDGNDVLFSRDAGGTIDGLAGNDVLFGLGESNVLNGGDGVDSFFAQCGTNEMDGGADRDIAYFWGINRADAQVIRTADGRIRITTAQSDSYIVNVETFQFKDVRLTLEELLPDQEYRSVDGSGNNLLDVDLGSTDEQLIRIADPEYSDGIAALAGDDRPGAREVSNEIGDQQTTEPNDRNLTDTTWIWGQFLDHDISISEGATQAEPANIPVPLGDTYFDPTATGDVELGFNRTVYDPETGDAESNPRQQINQITSFIDGSMIYGSDLERAVELREFDGGRLRMSDGDLLIFNEAGLPNQDGGLPIERQFLAGDVRANENIALTAMHTVWAREHNRIADELAVADTSLTDEQLYQRARELVVAEIQVITYNEFLPALLGQEAIESYAGYDSSVDVSVTNEFSTAAYRFGHTMLSSELLRLNNDGSESDAGNIALLDGFFSPDEIIDHGIDSLLVGATQQLAGEVDTMIIDDVRNFLFGPPGAGGMDLASLNIQRGRDHGLAGYNEVRAVLGLGAVTEFSQITSDVALQEKLEQVYCTVDNIDLWVGGLAEDHVAGSSMGATFQAIIVDQFTRLRDGDRFWYQNLFDGAALQQLESITLADVIERNTTVAGLQENVFFLS